MRMCKVGARFPEKNRLADSGLAKPRAAMGRKEFLTRREVSDLRQSVSSNRGRVRERRRGRRDGSCKGRNIRHDGGKPARFFQRIGCVVMLLFGFTAGVHAHQGSSSYLTVTVDGTNVTGQWDISLIDLEQVVGLDADHDGNITWSETRAKQREIESYALSRL